MQCWCASKCRCARLFYLVLLRGTDRRSFPRRSPGHHNCQVDMSLCRIHCVHNERRGDMGHLPCVLALIRRKSLFTYLQRKDKAITLNRPTASQPVLWARRFFNCCVSRMSSLKQRLPHISCESVYPRRAFLEMNFMMQRHSLHCNCSYLALSGLCGCGLTRFDWQVTKTMQQSSDSDSNIPASWLVRSK